MPSGNPDAKSRLRVLVTSARGPAEQVESICRPCGLRDLRNGAGVICDRCSASVQWRRDARSDPRGRGDGVAALERRENRTAVYPAWAVHHVHIEYGLAHSRNGKPTCLSKAVSLS